MNKKNILKDKIDFLNLFIKSKKGQYSLFSLLTLSVLLISGLFTFSLLRNTDTAKAALNCPAGSSLSGGQCISNTPSGYTCPAGQTVSGATCTQVQQTGTSYSCPQGGSVSGASCVATPSTPITVAAPACLTSAPVYENFPFSLPPNFCSLGNLSTVIYGSQPRNPINSCAVTIDGPTAIQVLAASGVFGFSPGNQYTYVGTLLSTNNICYAYVSMTNPVSNAAGAYVVRGNGYYTQNYSYAATGTPTYGNVLAGNANPQYTTPVTPTSYTPEPGQISSLSCTPTSVSDSGTVTCTGQGTGAPSGIPYSGNITVTIDNGGGSITTTINPDGTFTASAIPVGTIPSSTPVTKTATTNLGGTTPITVNPSSITVDPDLASGPGSISSSTDCTAATTTVTIGSTYSCSFPINGTGPFVLPTGGISARTNQALNNTTPTSACTITGTSLNILTCTAITTAATPNPLTPGVGNVQLGKGTTPSTWNTKGSVSLNAIVCTLTQPCALFESALTYSPIQTLAKRYGGSGSTQSADLILTLKDTRLETVGYTTTCTIKYKFKIGIGSNPPAYTTLADNVAYNNTTGCTGTLAKANQTLFNVDFEITAVSSNTAVPTSPVVRNFLLYANYDFKAGSIGVTSIGGSGL